MVGTAVRPAPATTTMPTHIHGTLPAAAMMKRAAVMSPIKAFPTVMS